MKQNELLNMFCEALERPADSLTAEMKIEDVEEWNSIGWLTLMSLSDERLNIQLGAKDIRGFKTVQEVLDYYAKQGALEK
jgi:acyl carrier protein